MQEFMRKTRTYEEMRRDHEQQLVDFYNNRAATWKKLTMVLTITEKVRKEFNDKWDTKYQQLVDMHNKGMSIKLAQERDIRLEKRKINNVINLARENQRWLDEQEKKPLKKDEEKKKSFMDKIKAALNKSKDKDLER